MLQGAPSCAAGHGLAGGEAPSVHAWALALERSAVVFTVRDP
jgi:hypothetical protein